MRERPEAGDVRGVFVTSMAKQSGIISQITLRPSRPDDYDFALELYLQSTRRLLIELGRWDQSRVVARFQQGFKPDEVQIICADGADIGCMQISSTDGELHLDQLHIVASFRNHAIGTQLILALQDRARNEGKSVGLNVIRGNQAVVLYRRLGFRIVGEDEEKFNMRWDAEGSDRS